MIINNYNHAHLTLNRILDNTGLKFIPCTNFPQPEHYAPWSRIGQLGPRYIGGNDPHRIVLGTYRRHFCCISTQPLAVIRGSGQDSLIYKGDKFKDITIIADYGTQHQVNIFADRYRTITRAYAETCFYNTPEQEHARQTLQESVRRMGITALISGHATIPADQPLIKLEEFGNHGYEAPKQLTLRTSRKPVAVLYTRDEKPIWGPHGLSKALALKATPQYLPLMQHFAQEVRITTDGKTTIDLTGHLE